MSLSDPPASEEDNAVATAIPAQEEERVYSPEHITVLNQLQDEGQKKFPASTSTYYSSRKELIGLVRQWGEAKGFAVSVQGSSIQCKKASRSASRTTRSRKDVSQTPVEKRRKVNDTRCGCKFVIKFSNAAPLIASAPKDSVRITDGSSYLHGGGCFPSQAQLLSDKRAGGQYMKHLKSQNLQTLLNLVRLNNHVTARVMRNMMRPLFPNAYAITSRDISNLRFKLKKYVPSSTSTTDGSTKMLSSSECAYLLDSTNELANEVNTSHDAPLDTVAPDFLDKASLHARTILQHVLNAAGSSEADAIENLLKMLHNEDPGFTYRIAYAADGTRCGYVWMTPMMRADWEQYGHTLFLDAMLRQLNSVCWPYIAAVLATTEGPPHSLCVAQ
jgi:hypothetical protein